MTYGDHTRVPAAQVFAAQGWTNVLASTTGSYRSRRARRRSAGIPTDDELVLLAHSNAGAYVPAITSRHSSIVGAVFVDALPPPRRDHVAIAPPTFLDFLRLKVDAAGLLPVWADWWQETEVAASFPNDASGPPRPVNSAGR